MSEVNDVRDEVIDMLRQICARAYPKAGGGWMIPTAVKKTAEELLASIELDRHRAAPPAVWSREKPTEAGWYWYQNNDVPIVVCVYLANAGLFFEYPTGECVSVKYVAGEWAGPLRPPVEGKG